MSDEAEGVPEKFIEFKCPACGTDTSFADTSAGALEECPWCSVTLVVPLKEGEPGRLVPVPIETPRLVLRRLSMEDSEDLLKFAGDERMYQFEELLPFDEDSIKSWLAADQDIRLIVSGTTLLLGIQLKDKGNLIGWTTIGLREYPGVARNRQGVLGVMIDPQQQRKGYGTEALRGLLEFCFNGIHLRRVVAACDGRNQAMNSALTTVGLRPEGELFQERNIKGFWANTLLFAMLAGEYTGSSAQ